MSSSDKDDVYSKLCARKGTITKLWQSKDELLKDKITESEAAKVLQRFYRKWSQMRDYEDKFEMLVSEYTDLLDARSPDHAKIMASLKAAEAEALFRVDDFCDAVQVHAAEAAKHFDIPNPLMGASSADKKINELETLYAAAQQRADSLGKEVVQLSNVYQSMKDADKSGVLEAEVQNLTDQLNQLKATNQQLVADTKAAHQSAAAAQKAVGAIPKVAASAAAGSSTVSTSRWLPGSSKIRML